LIVCKYNKSVFYEASDTSTCDQSFNNPVETVSSPLFKDQMFSRCERTASMCLFRRPKSILLGRGPFLESVGTTTGFALPAVEETPDEKPKAS
jgi:hypothetical protein